MKKIERFEDLEVWKEATEVAVDIYLESEKGRLRTDFGMKDQIRRAASSISNNIAEGFEYDNNKDFIRFLTYAKGSSGELRNQLYILVRAGLIDEVFYNRKYDQLISLSRQIAGFKKYLKQYEKNKNVKNDNKQNN